MAIDPDAYSAVDLKAATPDSSVPSGALIFGADSQSAAAPSVYPLADLANALPFTQSGEGAVARTAQDKLQEWVSVLDFIPPADHAAIAAGTSSVDCAPYFAKAIAAAAARGCIEVRIPAGRYLIGSTIALDERVRLRGDGDSSRLVPTISDGSPVIDVAATLNFFSLEHFRIDSEITLEDYADGTASAQNCTGIRLQASGGRFAARYGINSVMVRGCAIGYDIQGFIGSMENLWASMCDVGLKGSAMNSVRLNYRAESNRKAFEIVDSFAIHFDQLIDEGGPLHHGLQSSTMDNCHGVMFSAPYFEQLRNSPFISFGGTTLCKSISIQNGTVGLTNGALADYDVYPLAFDKVDGLTVSGYFETGHHHNFYSVTANTRNILDLSSHPTGNFFGPHDNSLNLSPALNYFPNPNFDLWFRGWPTVAPVNVTVTRETTLVRRGPNAVRITAAVGQTFNYLQWVFNDSYLGVLLRGKTVTLYAWVWVPDTADFNPNDTTSQVAQVVIEISSDGTGGGSAASGAHHTARGAWNLMKVATAIPVDASRIDIYARITTPAGASGSEYIVIDSMYLIEGAGQDIAIRNGWVKDSDLNPCRALGGMASIRGAAAPSDTDQSYAVGDQVWKPSPAAGASPGWVCTTAGAGGTAVFTAMADLAS